MFITLVLVSSTLFAANAQRNSTLLYGNVSYSSNAYGGTTQWSNWQINPGIGYQFDDNWTAGVNLQIGGGKSIVGATTNNYNKNSSTFAGPFLRHTKAFTSLFAIWNQVSVMFGSSKMTPFTGAETRYTGMGLYYNPAIGLNLYKGFGINFSFGGLQYATSRADVTGAKTSADFNLTFGDQFNVGISKNFAQKRAKRP